MMWDDMLWTISGNTTADPASLETVLMNYDEEFTIFDFHVYDAIWASAIAAAAAVAANPNKTEPPSGREIMLQIARGGVPGFNGAAGFHKFLPNGDSDMESAQVQISNYVVQPGASQGRQVVVALVDLRSSGSIAFSDIERITWPNGKKFPYVSNISAVPHQVLMQT
jgi:hypothetical protein